MFLICSLCSFDTFPATTSDLFRFITYIFRCAFLFKMSLAILLLPPKKLELLSKRYLQTSYLLFKISEKLAREYLNFPNIIQCSNHHVSKALDLIVAYNQEVSKKNNLNFISIYHLCCLQEYPDITIRERSSVYCCNVD